MTVVVPDRLVEAVRIEMSRNLLRQRRNTLVKDIEVYVLRDIVHAALVFYETEKRSSSESGPWWCGTCGAVVEGRHAPCPKCGPVRTP